MRILAFITAAEPVDTIPTRPASLPPPADRLSTISPSTPIPADIDQTPEYDLTEPDPVLDIDQSAGA